MNEHELGRRLAEVLRDGAPDTVLAAELVADIGPEPYTPHRAMRSGWLVDVTGPRRGAATIVQPHFRMRGILRSYFAAASVRGVEVSQVEARFRRETPDQPLAFETRVLPLTARREILAAAAPHVASLRATLRAIDERSQFVSLAFDEDPLRTQPVTVKVFVGRPYEVPVPAEADRALTLLRNVYLNREQRLCAARLVFHLDEGEDVILDDFGSLISTGFLDGRTPQPVRPLPEEDDAI